MDIQELFSCCRKGDLERVRVLVEQKDVELNVRDKWDSTPLYYACLCGHIDLVKYLLENGAKCEAQTFDGERCVYGALSDNIRNLLRRVKVVTTHTIQREPYHEALRKLLESGDYADVAFDVHGVEFCAHRCILAVRSEYFEEQFLGKWRHRTRIHLQNELVNPYAFGAVMQYLYTGRLECPLEYHPDVSRLAKQCRLTALEDRIEKIVRNLNFFQSTKPGTRVSKLVVEPQVDTEENCQLQRDFGLLAESALPVKFCNWVGASVLPFFPEERSPFADVTIVVEGHKFHCHKAFLCSRSEYFRVFLRDPLNEQQPCCSGGGGDISEFWLPVFTLHHVSATVFVHILQYIYANTTEPTTTNVYDIVVAADLFLLPGLKKLCGNFIARFLDSGNVVSVLRIARLFQLHRLEDCCYEFIAQYIHELVASEDLRQLIVEDAGELKNRQETDTIDIIDNIRYYLTASSFEEANEQLTLIDNLLQSLGLEA